MARDGDSEASGLDRRGFGAFWAGQSAAVAATQLREFVVPVFAVVVLSATPAQLGVVAAAQWLPFLLLALPLGVLFDRGDRARLLVLSQLGSLLAVTGLAVATVAGWTTVPLLIAAVFVWGVFTVVFEVGYQSAVPDYAPRAHLTRANGRLQSSAAIADIGGPGVGGILIQLAGATLALLVTAGANLVAAIAFLFLPRTPKHSDGAGTWWQALREGVAFTVGDRYLRANVGFSAIYNSLAQWVTVLFTAYALRELGLDAWAIGIVFSVGAVGALLGASSAGAVARRMRFGTVMVACATIETAAFLVVPALQPSWPRTVIVIALCAVWFLVGVGTALSNVLLITLRQVRTPHALLGRVNASMRTVTYGVIPLGAIAGGLAGQWLGLRGGILVGSVLLLGTILFVATSPLARLRTLSDADTVHAEAGESATADAER
ncbi:MFS transporter [Microbacterium sp. AZCO]|uniref:MFS transporter n=1 Tax=Microbacterium sp. AZCO TaxID=3142976 RepID=UPI0031F420FF